MNNDYQIKQSDYVELQKLSSGKMKNFSESEKKIIEIALQKFSSGKDVFIPHPIAEKLIQIIVDSADLEQKTTEVYSREISKTSAVSKEKPHTVNEANRVMWKLLGNMKAVDGNEEIIISGQVLSDGRGDWAAIRNMHKILSKKFPDRPIRIIVNSSDKWKDKLDTSDIDKSRLHLIYQYVGMSQGANVPLDAFPEGDEILKKAQDASILISAGVSMNSIFDSIWDELNEKSIKMYEHDIGSTSVADKKGKLGDAIIQAGLKPEDNRMGVFTNSYTEDYKWNDISSPNLLSALFDTSSLDENIINSYTDSHACFFGYLSESSMKYPFVQDVVKFAQKNSPDKVIDICIPGDSTLHSRQTREMWQASAKRVLVKGLTSEGGHDVGKVQLVWFEGGEKKEYTIDLDNNIANGATREIRIIDPGTISNRDFKIMTNLSGPLVACTGDNSLAQALSYGKIPFYENRFQEKWRGFTLKVEDVMGKDSALYKYCLDSTQYLNVREDRVDKGYNNILKEGIVEEAKQFGRYIRAEANLKPILNGVVNEKILRRKDLEFAEQQDALREKYLDNSISEAELQIQFKALLSERDLV